MTVDVTTWFLEMKSPEKLRRSAVPQPVPRFERASVPSPELGRFLYTAVGGDWFWRERLEWDYARWMQWIGRAELETWLLHVQGTPAGFVELEKQAGDDVEIVSFGLLPRFMGRGLGGHLLTLGLERAWEMGARRVWVHTCSLDAPVALKNFEARVIHRYHWEKDTRPAFGPPDGPWPDAGRPLRSG
jgi:GNAT superfamily N-acetyltransferase